MFAITRKIVYKWHGMGDGVRNEAEDEVLSVGVAGTLAGGKKGMEVVNAREKGGRWRNGRGRNRTGDEERKNLSVWRCTFRSEERFWIKDRLLRSYVIEGAPTSYIFNLTQYVLGYHEFFNIRSYSNFKCIHCIHTCRYLCIIAEHPRKFERHKFVACLITWQFYIWHMPIKFKN